MFIEIFDHMLYRLENATDVDVRNCRGQAQNITIRSTPLRQNIGTNVETQSRSANNSEFPGFIIFKLAMKIHSEKTD